jgi:tRNA 2-thiocytidine biosynthesis protein TtcA
VAVKRLLADWEREFPGRTESIFSALRNVSPAQLADPAAFDFAGLEALRARALESGSAAEPDGEPWDA